MDCVNDFCGCLNNNYSLKFNEINVRFNPFELHVQFNPFDPKYNYAIIFHNY